MKRRIIEIDESRCNGCGLCASACHEGAIGIVNGVAKLLRDDYCDGMGDCLPACPMDAIRFIEREAAAYDEAAVAAHKSAKAGEKQVCPGSAPRSIERQETEGKAGAAKQSAGKAARSIDHPGPERKAGSTERLADGAAKDECEPSPAKLPCGCPGTESRAIEHPEVAAKLPCGCPGTESRAIEHPEACACATGGASFADAPSRLGNWPVQIQLAPVRAPYFEGKDLLIAADCTAYAYGAFHEKFIKNRATLIGCPKLDGVNYAEKLAAILASNAIRSVTLTRMLVPCCGGLERMAKEAIKNSGKQIPLEVVTIGMDGEIVRVERG